MSNIKTIVVTKRGPFDPWKSSLSDALLANQDALDSNREVSDPTLPIFQYDAAQKVKEIEQVPREKRTGSDILFAVYKCLQCGLVAPEWLAFEFCSRWSVVNGAHVDSWDHPEAFGRPFKKDTKLPDVRRIRLLEAKVNSVVRKLLFEKQANGKPIAVDEAFWERAGEEIGVYWKTAEAHYRRKAGKLFVDWIKVRKAKKFPYYTKLNGKTVALSE